MRRTFGRFNSSSPFVGFAQISALAEYSIESGADPLPRLRKAGGKIGASLPAQGLACRGDVQQDPRRVKGTSRLVFQNGVLSKKVFNPTDQVDERDIHSTAYVEDTVPVKFCGGR
jgi:hypothetical protein